MGPVSHPVGCDLHLHLGGSVDKTWLIDFAKKDANREAIAAIERGDVLELFAVAHGLINSPACVADATENVIAATSADYVEIRSTPRAFATEGSLRPYIGAFATALRKHPDQANGLLSIDRYKHDRAAGQAILDLALEYADCIVGVDIAGVNLHAQRVLAGQDLADMIQTILDGPLGLALHIGEFDNDQEEADSTAALTAIDEWLDRHPQTPAAGKIRLGHALFLNDAHKAIVRKHQLPIEVCPTCHRRVGSWAEGQPHPVQDIYPDSNAPVVLGTDDALNFATNFQRETEIFKAALPYDLTNAWRYRFNRSP